VIKWRKNERMFFMKLSVKLLSSLLALSMLFCSAAYAEDVTQSLSGDEISILIDNENLVPKDANGALVPPFIENGSTYVPVRAVAEAFDLSVSWDGDTKTVFIGDRVASRTGEYINIFIDGAEFEAKDALGRRVYPILRDGTTYLPIRAIGEALGKSVAWDSVLKTVYIITPIGEDKIKAVKDELAYLSSLQGNTLTSFIVTDGFDDFYSDETVTTPLSESAFVFSVLSDEMLSQFVTEKDGLYTAVIDSEFLIENSGIPLDSFKDCEFGKSLIHFNLSSDPESVSEDMLVPVKATKDGETTTMALVLLTFVETE
jgi:hypothetical protein